LNSVQFDELHNLFSDQATQGRNIKLFNYLSLPFHPKFSKIQLNDDSPIWNRHSLQTGILDVFGFALNLNWTNFPIKGTFLPFTNYIIYSNTTNKQSKYKSTGTAWEQILDGYYSSRIYHVPPDGSKEILIIDNNNKVTVNLLKTPGYHRLQTDSIEIEKIAVNINSEELQSQVRDFKDIKEFTSGNIEVISMEGNILAEIKKARIGVELWRYFLYATILLLILEMIISNAKKQR